MGLVLADDYGPSWDETNTVPYGRENLEAFLTLRAPEPTRGNLRYYGPLFLALTEGLTTIGRLVMPAWETLDLRHLVYFLCLPVTAVCLYALARRWVSPRTALLASLLFASQPLLFGHAFINSKDIPFLSFFLMAISLGVRMVERVDPRGLWMAGEADNRRGFWSATFGAILRQFQLAARSRKLLLAGALGFALAISVELIFLQSLVLPSWLAGVRQAYRQESVSVINRAFTAVAEGSGRLPEAAYMHKAAQLYLMVNRPIALVSFFPAILVLRNILRRSFESLQPPHLFRETVLAGVALGMATSIRVIGPFAGVLVTGLAIVRSKRASLGPLVAYWTVAAVVTYLTWPYLWGSPWERFWESLRAMREFETEMPVLFRGQVYPANGVPGYFVPFLFALQLTEPILLLALAGAGLALRRAKGEGRRASQLVAALWLILPLSLSSFSSAARYDNGRQFLFVLPPLFLFAGISIEELSRRIGAGLWRAIIAVTVLAPGILAILRLHPYEYVYYNSLVGGVRGVDRVFELDYWATSYRQGVGLVNEVAPVGSSVFVFGPWEGVDDLLRPDLEIYDPPDQAFDPAQADYLLVTTRANLDLGYRRFADVVEPIRVEGVDLAYLLRSPEAD